MLASIFFKGTYINNEDIFVQLPTIAYISGCQTSDITQPTGTSDTSDSSCFDTTHCADTETVTFSCDSGSPADVTVTCEEGTWDGDGALACGLF